MRNERTRNREKRERKGLEKVHADNPFLLEENQTLMTR